MENENNNEKLTNTIFINTTTPPDSIFGLIKAGNVIIVPNTVDIMEFLDNSKEVEEYAKEGKIIFHAWAPTALQQWNKTTPMYSSAYEDYISYEKAISDPKFCALAEIIDKCAIPKENWLDKEFEFPEFPEELLEKLGLTPKANRTDVKRACDENNRPDIWEQYDEWYAGRLAAQHGAERVQMGNESIDVSSIREKYATLQRPNSEDFAKNVPPERAASGTAIVPETLPNLNGEQAEKGEQGEHRRE